MPGDDFQKLSWNRNSYFSAYPENHLGSPVGEVDFNQKPETVYCEKPQHNWEMDSRGILLFRFERSTAVCKHWPLAEREYLFLFTSNQKFKN